MGTNATTCIAPPSKHAPKAVKDAEERLHAIIAEGQRLISSGSFEEREKNDAARRAAEQALKNARVESKAEKRAIKDLAAASMSAASWTSTLSSALGGDGDSRFSKAEEDVERQLAERTVGLVSAGDFRERRKTEAEQAAKAGKREREEASVWKRRQRRRRSERSRRRRN